MKLIFGVFIVLHGLIHLLYFGQSARYFELKAGMTWPDGSWMFSRLFGDGVSRNLAGLLLILAAIGLFVGGIAMLLGQAWWRPMIVGAAAFSSIVYIVLWDGTTQNLDGQGLVGLFINVVILVALLILRWPSIE